MKITSLFHIIETANILYADVFGLDGDEVSIYINNQNFGNFRNFADFSRKLCSEYLPGFANQIFDCDLHSQSPYQLRGEFKAYHLSIKIEIYIHRF